MISESLINTVGTFSKWGDGGDITSGTDGLTSATTNTHAVSSNVMTSSNTYQKIDWEIKFGGGQTRVGLAYGSDFSKISSIQVMGDGDLIIYSPAFGIQDRTGTSITSGNIYKLTYEYDNGTINGYIDDSLVCTYNYDWSSYSTWKPIIWLENATSFIRSYTEVVPGGISASKRSINC